MAVLLKGLDEVRLELFPIKLTRASQVMVAYIAGLLRLYMQSDRKPL
jgi:hypothetical protein